jgi:glycosyltransferase involved in cell wall biosynthesis
MSDHKATNEFCVEAIELSVVMPCLNEARTIKACVREAREAMKVAGIQGEVTIADNGSVDGSQALALEEGARVVAVSAKGYGNALRGGIAAAQGRFLIMGDADQSYDFSHLPRFMERLREGADLVMGNRFRGGISAGAMPWKNRFIGNPILSFLGRLLFRVPVGDFHCGLRAFSREAYRRMDLRTTGMEFASEMVIKAALQGMRIDEVPTVLRPDGRGRPPHLRPWRDGWRHLRFMLLFSPRWLFLYPGLALFLTGFLTMGLLLPGPRHLGRIELDVHTLLFASIGVLVGFQSVIFAVLSKSFAVRAGLQPREERFQKLMEIVSMEAGLIAGALLGITGICLSVGAVWLWKEQGFGALQPTQTLRWVIPGGLCLSLGCELILASFFLGVIQLDTRSDSP